ncbi:MAG: M2 family metallopeptidase [Bryobacteraceae bacterium]
MRSLLFFLLAILTGCANSGGDSSSARRFLNMYNDLDQKVSTVAAEASWKASTDVSEQHTGERMGATGALAAFRGSRYIIDNTKQFLGKGRLSELDTRQLDKILLAAAEFPGTIPDVVQARVAAEARAGAILDGFTFCMERQGEKCVKTTTPNQIDDTLDRSRQLAERRKVWEVSKQTGPALKQSLAELRDLRNRVAAELGYSSFFHLQVADYGMSVAEMVGLMDGILKETRPLYDQLHRYARHKLATRYGQPVPEKIPAHWLGNRWGQEWPGLVEAVDLDDLMRGKSPEWIVQQAERFYTSLGMPALPKSFWEKSDLYELPPGSKRKKNTHASAWHIDTGKDVRSLMSVTPNFRWFETTHHELGHVYYYMAYSNPNVPYVLRGGANRAFHEAVGDLIGIASRQLPYLREVGLLSQDRKVDQTQWLLSEALDSAGVFLPWSAGVMTHFEHDLYEKKLPVDQFNRRWWELVGQHQGIEPPAPRGEEFCDGCTKTHVIDDPAQYYDYALAYVIKYQLHDHIAKKILKQDPHNCNYYGNKDVGKWLWELLSLGATQDWRKVIREKTGEDISARAMLEYFRPVGEYLAAQKP